MIRFLQRHKSEAVKIARLQVARVCERWLIAGSLAGAREEAAELALDMAEYLLARKIAFWRGVHDDELDRIVFRAALESFSAAPDRTRELVLIACGRRPPSGRILETIQTFLGNVDEGSCRREHREDWVELPQLRHWLDYVPASKLPDQRPDGQREL